VIDGGKIQLKENLWVRMDVHTVFEKETLTFLLSPQQISETEKKGPV
jgi:hypothetical protein